jgi:hypothetical protein
MFREGSHARRGPHREQGWSCRRMASGCEAVVSESGWPLDVETVQQIVSCGAAG